NAPEPSRSSVERKRNMTHFAAGALGVCACLLGYRPGLSRRNKGQPLALCAFIGLQPCRQVWTGMLLGFSKHSVVLGPHRRLQSSAKMPRCPPPSNAANSEKPTTAKSRQCVV